MPYFLGLELTDYARNQLKLSTPIIVPSSVGYEENIVCAFKLSTSEFMAKPVSSAELICVCKKN